MTFLSCFCTFILGRNIKRHKITVAAFALVYVIPIIEILTQYHSDTENILSARFEGQRSVDTDD